MASETSRFNREVLGAVGAGQDDAVIEVGFGHGRTLATAAASARSATFAGLDISTDALRVASRRCRSSRSEGRMDLRVGDAAALPWPDAFFTKAFTVHTLYFWKEPAVCLRELRRVLRPGGRLVIGFRERSAAAEAALPASVYRLYTGDEVVELLRAAGFVAELRRAESADHLWIAIGTW